MCGQAVAPPGMSRGVSVTESFALVSWRCCGKVSAVVDGQGMKSLPAIPYQPVLPGTGDEFLQRNLLGLDHPTLLTRMTALLRLLNY